MSKDDKPDQSPPIASFRMPTMRLLVILALVLANAGIGLALLEVGLTTLNPLALVLGLLWCAAVTAIGWAGLGKFAYWIELTEQTLRWRTVVRRGQAPLSTVRRIRPQPSPRMRPTYQLIEFDHRPHIIVKTRWGITQFAADLVRLAPHVEVELELNWWVRLSKRLGLPSGYRPGGSTPSR